MTEAVALEKEKSEVHDKEKKIRLQCFTFTFQFFHLIRQITRLGVKINKQVWRG
jgi:hypothetical protein